MGMQTGNSVPDYRLTESLNETIERCLDGARDEHSQVVVEIYVEGIHDVDFYESWIDKSGIDIELDKLSVVVKEVRDVENCDGTVIPEGISGNCALVRKFAELNGRHIRKIWISDRDLLTDDDLINYSRDNLFFTDFPAIESYGFQDSVLDSFNEDRYGGKLESLKNHIDLVRSYLKSMYFYRCALQKCEKSEKANSRANQLHHMLKNYVEANGDNLSIDGLVEFSGSLFTHEMVAVVRSVDSDIVDFRSYVYGHDVGSALKGIIANDERILSSKYPVNSKKHIEQYIRDKYISAGLYKHDTLFESLRLRIEYIYNSMMK